MAQQSKVMSERQLESKYTGKLGAKLMFLLRRPYVPGVWKLLSDDPAIPATWSRFAKFDGSVVAIKKVRIKGQNYWFVFTMIGYDKAAAAVSKLLAFGALGLLLGDPDPEPLMRVFRVDPETVHSSVFLYERPELFKWLENHDDIKNLAFA